MSYAWYRTTAASLEELRREAAAAVAGADGGLLPGEALLIACDFFLPFGEDRPLAGIVPGAPEWQVAQYGRAGWTMSFRIWRVPREPPSAPGS